MYENCQPLVPEDLADIIYFVVTRPRHVNIGRLVVTPVCQSDGGTVVYKGPSR
ncbi:MAG: hypothetical protein LIP28_10300 [Deltaproteobacteria bacterium]|nr:hypothetical protein [Deltaproteobacteria bacterium]